MGKVKGDNFIFVNHIKNVPFWGITKLKKELWGGGGELTIWVIFPHNIYHHKIESEIDMYKRLVI